MITLSIEAINAVSPYKVSLNHGDYDFVTADGIRYSASFLEDVPSENAILISLASARKKIFMPLLMPM